MRRITIREVWSQIRADLFGKDSYRGITLSYAWLANQCGHFSLSFIPTFIVYTALDRFTSSDNAPLLATLTISIAWVAFELWNLLAHTGFKKRSRYKRIYFPSRKEDYDFEPNWSNLWYDNLTDMSFFILGAISAYALISLSQVAFGIVLGLSIAIYFVCCRHWYRTKMYLQAANFPFQFRLCQWDKYISGNDKATVNEFRNNVINNPNSGRHLLIFGTNESGKTSLGVGIGTELSIKHCDCSYITASKLYSVFAQPPAEDQSLWTCRDSSVVIVDDINPGDPVSPDLISPKRFLHYLKRQRGNKNWIVTTNFIWILGSSANVQESWEDLLVRLGVDRPNIRSISLSPEMHFALSATNVAKK